MNHKRPLHKRFVGDIVSRCNLFNSCVFLASPFLIHRSKYVFQLLIIIQCVLPTLIYTTHSQMFHLGRKIILSRDFHFGGVNMKHFERFTYYQTLYTVDKYLGVYHLLFLLPRFDFFPFCIMMISGVSGFVCLFLILTKNIFLTENVR